MNSAMIEQNFSRQASTYDLYADVQREAMRPLIGLLPKCGRIRITEIGCGTGLFTEELVKLYPGSEIMAVDISSTMIEKAREKKNLSGVEFLAADGAYIRPAQKMDLIASHAALHWLHDPEAAIKLYAGLLKEGGGLVFSVFGPGTYRELDIVMKELCEEGCCVAASTFLTKDRYEKALNGPLWMSGSLSMVIRKTYPSLESLLITIRATGTRGAGRVFRGLWTKKFLKRAEALYRCKFREIAVTYEVFYFSALQSKGGA